MSEYWSFFSQYFNLFSIIWGGIKIGLLSFIVLLILLIALKKFVLVRRRYKALKYLAYSYYFFIPIIGLCLGFLYGAISTSRDQVIEKLPFYQSSIQSVIEQNFNFNIEISSYSEQSLNSTLDDVVTQAHSMMIAQLKLSDTNRNQTQNFIIMVLDSPIGMRYLKSTLKDKLSSTVGLERGLVDEVFEVKLSNLLSSEVIIKIFAFYIKQLVNGFLLPIMIIWGLLLLIPLIEILFSYSYNKKYQVIVNEINSQTL